MRPDRERKAARPFFLHSVDHLGREIDPGVLSVAQDLASLAVLHGETILGDPALALTLLEEVAANVSLAIQSKALLGEPPIEDLAGYLYRSFEHQLEKETRRTPNLLAVDDLDWTIGAPQPGLNAIEKKLLQEELLKSCDTLTLVIILRRLDGQSWREIGAACGISPTAARLRFRKAILRMRHIAQSRDHSG